MNEKLNVAVLFGGSSDEYHVSLHSAAGVLRALDPQRYTVVKIGIDPQGDWFLTNASAAEIEADTVAYSIGSASATDLGAQ